MAEVEDASVALVVTSPPYFAGKEYEQALGEGHVPGSYLDYLGMLRDVFAECRRVLEPGGRMAVNVANLGRKPYRSLAADVIGILQDDLGLLLRGEVVWLKARGATGSCAWGSFRSPANPVLRDLTERVVVASKGRFDRAVAPRARERRGLPHVATVTTDEFMEATLDVWEIPPERATRVGHPAPFPVELPLRCIELYTYADDLVLDPFLGSGSTGVAAVRSGRRFVGYDTEPQYVQRAEARMAEERAKVLAEDGPARGGAGDAARRVVEELLHRGGFSEVRAPAKVAGVDVEATARDTAGRPWCVSVVGGFTVVPGGLRRPEAMWAVLGRAAVIAARAPGTAHLLCTADPPPRGSPADRAWRALSGPGGAVADVIDLLARDVEPRLRSWATGATPAEPTQNA